MIEIVGHTGILNRLRQGVPPVSLFVGEESVGKWTTAQWVRERMKLAVGDYAEAKFVDPHKAREVGRFLRTAPYGKRRLVVLYMANCGWTTQSILLHSLENLPPTSTAILVAPPDTLSPPILSRGEMFNFLSLRIGEVQRILEGRNFSPGLAEHLARLSGGHVNVALRYSQSKETKIAVLGAVRSLIQRDAKGLATFATRWSEEHSVLLDALCREALTGRHVIFEKEDAEALGRRMAMKILGALRTEVRPRLVVHAQLMGVLRGT